MYILESIYNFKANCNQVLPWIFYVCYIFYLRIQDILNFVNTYDSKNGHKYLSVSVFKSADEGLSFDIFSMFFFSSVSVSVLSPTCC